MRREIAQRQTQLGADIDGEAADDLSEDAVSLDDPTLEDNDLSHLPSRVYYLSISNGKGQVIQIDTPLAYPSSVDLILLCLNGSETTKPLA